MAYSDELFKRRPAPTRPSASVPAAVSSGDSPAPQTADPRGAVGANDYPPPQSFEPRQPAPAATAAASGSGWSGWVFTGMACLIILLVALLMRGYLPHVVNPDRTNGVYALIVYESDPDEAKSSYDQKLALSSVQVAKWLDEHCAKAQDGRPAWRMLDDDQKLDKEDPVWQKLRDKAPSDCAEPFVVMSGGKRELAEKMVDGGPDELIKELSKGE